MIPLPLSFPKPITFLTDIIQFSPQRKTSVDRFFLISFLQRWDQHKAQYSGCSCTKTTGLSALCSLSSQILAFHLLLFESCWHFHVTIHYKLIINNIKLQHYQLIYPYYYQNQTLSAVKPNSKTTGKSIFPLCAFPTTPQDYLNFQCKLERWALEAALIHFLLI